MEIKNETSTVLEDIYHTHDNNIAVESGGKRDSKILLSIIVLAVIGIVFGFWRMGGILERPLHKITVADIRSSYSDTDIAQNLALFGETSQAQLSAKDTDGDGLNDYDEINVYKTSPYLEDMDSDGVSDFEEIKQGTNPNCLGNNCNIEPDAIVQGGEESADIAALNNGITEISPSYLRTLLEKSGIASSYIQQLTDKEILEVYYATVPPGTQINPLASNTNVSNTNTATPQGQDIQKMSPQELRSFLIKSGMSKEMLDNFSDDEILQVLKETAGQ